MDPKNKFISRLKGAAKTALSITPLRSLGGMIKNNSQVNSKYGSTGNADYASPQAATSGVSGNRPATVTSNLAATNKNTTQIKPPTNTSSLSSPAAKQYMQNQVSSTSGVTSGVLNNSANTRFDKNTGQVVGDTTQPIAPPNEPKSAYLKFLTSQFDPSIGDSVVKDRQSAYEKLVGIQNESERKSLEARREYERLLDKSGGTLAGAQQSASQADRRNNSQLADLALQESAAARSAQVANDTYDSYISAGKTVYEAEQAAEKARKEDERYQSETAYKKEQDTFDNNLATKKFEEDKRQFGLGYALSQQKASGTSGVDLSSPQKTAINQVDTVLSSLDDYSALYNELANKGGGKIVGQAASQLNSAYNTLMFQIAQAAGTGALQAADREIVEKMIPRSGNVFSAIGQSLKGGKGGGLAGLGEARKLFVNKKQAILSNPTSTSNYNSTGQQGTVITKNGQSFDASELSQEELDQALADGYTMQ